MKTALVTGAGGFIGSHMAHALRYKHGYRVIGADLKKPEYSDTACDVLYIGDLRDIEHCKRIFSCHKVDMIYTFAADMGGAGYIFTGDHNANILHNSAQINLNMAEMARLNKVEKLFFSSSACIYPKHNQEDPNNPICSEASAYPAYPDSEYGWEKLFSERLYLAYREKYKLDIKIARFHNIYGPEGTWDGGKEKAPAAMCRKAILGENNTSIDVWGPGTQTRSFLYIDECVEGVQRLMDSDKSGPYNIGSEEMVSINQLAQMAIKLSGKTLTVNNIPGPLGVKGRSSDNALIRKELGWAPSAKLIDGLTKTYLWIEEEIRKSKVNVLET